MSNRQEVTMALEPAQTLALAHFVKGMGWSEIHSLGELAKALREARYAPR